MTDFGGGEFKTSDGLDVSRDRPYGAMVLVYFVDGEDITVLLLHRRGLPADGDWAWTPPSGARQPGETIQECAQRELQEEAGFETTTLEAVRCEDIDWAVFVAEVPPSQRLQITEEHDDYAWVPGDEAASRCLPVNVAEGIRTAITFVVARRTFDRVRFSGPSSPSRK